MGNGELIMEKGYILVDVTETCIGCMFYDMGFCQAVNEKYISDDEIKHTPDWCPIQTWISATKQKPSNKKDVYVTLRDGSSDICWYAKEFDEWYDSNYNTKDVIKWLPFDIEQFKEK